MKKSIQAISAVLTMGCATLALAADEAPAKHASEYERQQNLPAPVAGTHATRQAERKVKQAELKEQQKSGQLPGTGDDWGMNRNQPAKVDGTHTSRAAERKEKRGEIKQLVKAGELPVSNEADVGAVKKSP